MRVSIVFVACACVQRLCCLCVCPAVVLSVPITYVGDGDVHPPLGGGFGIPNRSPDPLGRKRAEIIPHVPLLLGGKGISHVGWDAGDLPNLEKK
jgi:hypothetical protein